MPSACSIKCLRILEFAILVRCSCDIWKDGPVLRAISLSQSLSGCRASVCNVLVLQSRWLCHALVLQCLHVPPLMQPGDVVFLHNVLKPEGLKKVAEDCVGPASDFADFPQAAFCVFSGYGCLCGHSIPTTICADMRYSSVVPRKISTCSSFLSSMLPSNKKGDVSPVATRVTVGHAAIVSLFVGVDCAVVCVDCGKCSSWCRCQLRLLFSSKCPYHMRRY